MGGFVFQSPMFTKIQNVKICDCMRQMTSHWNIYNRHQYMAAEGPSTTSYQHIYCNITPKEQTTATFETFKSWLPYFWLHETIWRECHLCRIIHCGCDITISMIMILIYSNRNQINNSDLSSFLNWLLIGHHQSEILYFASSFPVSSY